MTISGTVAATAYAILFDANIGSTELVLDSCSGLKANAELFLHQTQFATGVLAGKYAYVQVQSFAAVGSGCAVTLTKALTTSFKSGEFWVQPWDACKPVPAFPVDH